MGCSRRHVDEELDCGRAGQSLSGIDSAWAWAGELKCLIEDWDWFGLELIFRAKWHFVVSYRLCDYRMYRRVLCLFEL